MLKTLLKSSALLLSSIALLVASSSPSLALGKKGLFSSTPAYSQWTRPTSWIPSDNPEIIAKAQELTAGMTTDRDKSFAIHKWVSTNIVYDDEAAAGKSSTGGAADALATLHRLKGMCGGYASLSTALHRAIGMEARAVGGFAGTEEDIQKKRASGEISGQENHYWVEVSIDGNWVSEDPTFDHAYIAAGYGVKEFAPAPEEFGKTHILYGPMDF